MPHASFNGKRGRPPGTGKNDKDRLSKIAALMAADPALRPTTAIKRIGETDPSTIRRLRDKYNEQLGVRSSDMLGIQPAIAAKPPHPVLAPVAIVAAVVAKPSPPAADRPTLAQSTTPKVALPIVAQRAEVEAATEIDFEQLFKPAPVQDPFMFFGKWFGNGIETAAVMFEQQMMFAQSLLRASPMKAVWRQQVVATEYLLMLSGPGQRIRAPNHVGAN